MTIRVLHSLDPIRGGWSSTTAEPGETLEAIVGTLAAPGVASYLRVRVGGHEVPQALWRVVRPKESVFVDLPLRGGGGGSKGGGQKLLSTVAGLAIAGAAMFVTGGGAAPLLGTAFLKGTMGAKLLGGALAVGANLALQGLQSTEPTTGGGGGQAPLGFAGAQNNFKPGDFLSRVIGEYRVAPDVVIPPFTEIDGDDQYATVVVGLAGEHEFGAIYSGDIDLADLANVEIETRPGTADDDPLTFVDDVILEEQVNDTLSRWEVDPTDVDALEDTLILGTEAEAMPQWHRVETKKSPGIFRIEFLMPGGMKYTIEDKGIGTVVRGRFRRRGLLGWGDWVNLPILFMRGSQVSKAVRLHFFIEWVDAYPAESGSPWPPVFDDYEGLTGWTQMFAKPGWASPVLPALNGGGGYNGWQYESDKKIRLFLLIGTYPKGRYQFEVMRSWSWPINEWNESTLEVEHADGNISDLFGAINSETEIPYNPNHFADEIIITSVQNRWDERPIEPGGLPVALIALRAKNRQLDIIKVDAKGVIDRLDDTRGTSANPADNYWEVLRGSHNAEPVPESRIIKDNLIEWRDWCDSLPLNKTVNTVVKGQPLVDVLRRIALCGWGSPTFAPQHDVVIDRVRPEGAVGMITQRNAGGFKFEKLFPILPHALRVSFVDALEEYETREVTVYAPGYNADGSAGLIEATRFQAISYEGITNEALARLRAAFDLRWMYYRRRLLYFRQPLEYLAHRRGDLVWLETDIVGEYGGRGRVKSFVSTGTASELSAAANIAVVHDLTSLFKGSTLVTEITIDEEPRFGAAEVDFLGIPDVLAVGDILLVGADKGIRVRCRDGTIATAKVASYSPNGRIVLDEPTAMFLNEDDLVMTGPLTVEGRRAIIWDIAPDKNMTASIVAVDYQPLNMYG